MQSLVVVVVNIIIIVIVVIIHRHRKYEIERRRNQIDRTTTATRSTCTRPNIIRQSPTRSAFRRTPGREGSAMMMRERARLRLAQDVVADDAGSIVSEEI